jgi:hypothetical protein
LRDDAIAVELAIEPEPDDGGRIRIARHDRREQSGPRLLEERERDVRIVALGTLRVGGDADSLEHRREGSHRDVEFRRAVFRHRNRDLARPKADANESYALHTRGERDAEFAALVRDVAAERRAVGIKQQ